MGSPAGETSRDRGGRRADRGEREAREVWEGVVEEGGVLTAAERTRRLRPEQHRVESWAGANSQGSEWVAQGPAHSKHYINT